MTSITIPDSVTSIEEHAFNGCTSLTSITIPSGVTSIEISAFEDCTSLISITIPDSVRYIYQEAFRGCTSLTSVTIPSSVTSIGVATFANCSGLTNITIPSSVTSIGNSAFEGCTGLTSITIPNSVTSIGNSAFYGCTGLTSITIPSNVTSIGDDAFTGCSSLTTVCIDSTTIANALTSATACGGLVNGENREIYFKNNITSYTTYLYNSFIQVDSDVSGYTKWIKGEDDIAQIELYYSYRVWSNPKTTYLSCVASGETTSHTAYIETDQNEITMNLSLTFFTGDDDYPTSYDMSGNRKYNWEYFTVSMEKGKYNTKAVYDGAGEITVSTDYNNRNIYDIYEPLDDVLIINFKGRERFRIRIFCDGITQVSVEGYNEVRALDASQNPGEKVASTWDENIGLQKMRVVGNQSYYDGDVKDYLKVPLNIYGPTGYGNEDSRGNWLLKEIDWILSDKNATCVYACEGYNGMYAYLYFDFSKVTPCTFDEIYNCTNPNKLTSGIVKAQACNKAGKELWAYTFIVVEGVNVFDADGYTNAGDSVVMQTDLDYNASNPTLTTMALNKTTIYGNGHLINYGYRNENGTYETTYKDDGYIGIVLSNIINLEIQGTTYDSTKESYRLSLLSFGEEVNMAYCNIHDMFRIIGYNSGTVNIKNCVFSRCKDSGILLASSSLSASSSDKTLNIENVIMFDVGQRAIELQHKSTVNISGFFDVYNFQSKDSLSSIDGLSSTEISTIMSKAEDSGLTMTRDGTTYVNLVGISTKTTSVNVNGGSNLTQVSGFLNTYKAWAYKPDRTSTSGAIMSYDNEFNSDGSLNTTYLESQLTKVSRK